MKYSDWESRFLKANQDHYEANMMLIELENEGEKSSQRYSSWIKHMRESKNSRDYFISEYPEFHTKYVNNRGTSIQTKLSEKYNGKGQPSDDLTTLDYINFFQVFFFPYMIYLSFTTGFDFTLIEFLTGIFILIGTLINSTTIITGLVIAALYVLSVVAFFTIFNIRYIWLAVISIFLIIPLVNGMYLTKQDTAIIPTEKIKLERGFEFQ